MTPNPATPFFSAEAFAALGAPDLVYVRPIKAAEILADVPVGVTDEVELSPDQLHVTVEGGQLVVAGRREAEGKSEADKAYLHRGIAARGFLRTFVLADGMEVTAATLEHGLLHVDLARPEPERLVRRIPIRSVG